MIDLAGYFETLKKFGEFLIRGNYFQTIDNLKLVIAQTETVKKNKAFSLYVQDMYNELAGWYLGEQRSIGELIYSTNDVSPETMFNLIKKAEECETQSVDTEFIEVTTKRLNEILRYMSLILLSGQLIPIGKDSFDNLVEYKKKVDGEKPNNVQLPRKESGKIQSFKSKVKENSNFLTFNVTKGDFEVVNKEHQLILQSIPIEIGMEIFNEFLEQEEAKRYSKRFFEQQGNLKNLNDETTIDDIEEYEDDDERDI